MTPEPAGSKKAAQMMTPEAAELCPLLMANAYEVAIFLTDSEGRIRIWNPGAERILGWSADEAVGRRCEMIFTPEDRAAGIPDDERMRAARDGQAEDIRWHLRCDGTRFFAEGVMTALREPSGNLRGFGKVLRDATERKLQEEKLAAAAEAVETSHRALNSILESISDAFYAVDAEFRFTYVNRRAEEWWKRRREDLLGRHFWSEYAGAVDSESYQRHLEAMTTRRPVHYETISPLLGHWVEVSIFPSDDGGLAVYFRDITDRKRSEQALHDALERERNIAQTLQRPLTLRPESDIFPGVTVAMHYEPASAEADAGGDFFDVCALPRGRVCLAVADASGKGLQAAARAVQVKEVLRAFAREYPHSPAQIAARINDYVYDNARLEPRMWVGERFVTLLLVILDPHTGDAAAVAAASEPLLVLRESGAVEIVEERHHLAGLPLGVQAGELYHSVPLRIERGDTLLLSTDGLSEARRGRTQFFGSEGVAAAARHACATASSLQAAADAIVEDARRFAHGRFRDDVCVLMARRR